MAKTTYRDDGWPNCPSCGEDELYSVVMLGWRGDTPRPTLAACLADWFRCYLCPWQGPVESDAPARPQGEG